MTTSTEPSAPQPKRPPRKEPAVEPLVVRPATAWKLLGCANTFGYALLERGELDSYLDGGARKITVESIHRYIAKRLAAPGKRKPRTSKHRQAATEQVAT